MATLNNPNDAVTVAPGVLLTLVQLAASHLEGVVGLANVPGGVDRWLRRAAGSEGVRLTIEEEGVRVDIYLLADGTRSLFDTSRAVQEEVSRTIKEYVGMNVVAVNVHIEDVQFPTQNERN
jgi:uncharacterized alkaline shock family protein YloU